MEGACIAVLTSCTVDIGQASPANLLFTHLFGTINHLFVTCTVGGSVDDEGLIPDHFIEYVLERFNRILSLSRDIVPEDTFNKAVDHGVMLFGLIEAIWATAGA